jgi:hypothetical protein
MDAPIRPYTPDGNPDSYAVDDPADEQLETVEMAAVESPILDSIRARRAEQAKERHYDIDLPGYGGLLVLRCQPIPARTLTVLRERLERSRSPDRDYNLNADTLIAACREVLGRAEAHHPLTVLTDQNDEAVKVDERLAEMLRLPAESARDVLRCLFEGANSPEAAVMMAAGQYMEWAASANGELDEELLGE